MATARVAGRRIVGRHCRRHRRFTIQGRQLRRGLGTPHGWRKAITGADANRCRVLVL